MTMPSGTPLPKNVAATGDLGTSLQNLNSGKVEDKSQNQMSAGFLGSSGGLASGVVTSVTSLFSGFMGNLVDDASTVTAETPEDVEQQVETFFGNPGSKLLDALLGFLSPILQGLTAGLAGAALELANLFSGRWNQVDTQQTVINEHDQSITELQAAFNQLTLQGNAIVFTSNNTYVPTPGVVSVDLILLGAGAGGAGGRWEVLNGGCAGGGGGGGGEVHVNVPGAFLPKTETGEYAPVAITIGAGGAYGNASPTNGTGGGDTDFGGLLTAGGGQGGQVGASGAYGVGGQGGSGMIPGGKGGDGLKIAPSQHGGNSTSAYDLHGGGGGGGGGSRQAAGGGTGGTGGISPGGTPGLSPVRDGTPPTSIVATGGGGGAGGDYDLETLAGPGAVPSGGGGGGYGSSTRSGAGGTGGAGMLFVIERMA